MKKLLLAASIAATSFAVNAKITNSDGFEGTNGTAYGEDAKPTSAAYPFAGFGDKYLAPDDEGTTFLAKGGTVFDMFVQFTYREDGDIGTDGKLGVYANTDGYLVVTGSTTTVTTKQVEKDSWHRLTIATSGTTDFIVYLDNIQVGDVYTGAKVNNTVTSVGVEGSGKVDNFVARTTNPFVTPASVVAEIGSEKFETYADALSDALKFDKAVTILGGNGNVVVDGTSAAPYQIPDVASLKALQEAVAAGYGADKFYVQTVDIDMKDAGAFAGIGVYNANPTAGTPFTGTYDGGNKKISNVTMTGRNYGGIFNQVNGGTIKNLTVENISTAATSGEFGYAIVGNAGNGATLENLTAAGTFLSSEKPGTHNMAGIVVRACGGGENGTLIKNCTNAATIYGAYTKMAGICAIAQHKVDGGPVTFDGCSNTGILTMPSGSTAGRDGLAGIIGYVNDDTVLKGCSNTGSMTSTLAAAKVGQLVGWAYDHELTDGGNNAARADAKMLAHRSPAEFKNDKDETHYCTVTGFQYATVDNGVATTVTTLANNGAYLLEGDVAASATPVFTFAEAGTIAFDAALGYTFEGTVAADTSRIASLDSATVDNVTTYTAVAGVASVGGQAYATLAEALAAATDGATVKLLANVALTGTQTISKSVTLDLNGKNVTATDCRAFHVTAGTVAFTGTGTISTVVTQGTKLASSSSVIRVGSNTAVTSFTLGENVTVTSDYCYGITYFGTQAQTVAINGTVAVTGAQAAISGNGTSTMAAVTLTVGGTVSATQDYAIYNPQTGTTAITGTVTGGIEVKAGTVTVAGTATVTARNVTPSHSSNQNGTSTQGYAIASVGNSSYKQPAKVSVAAGATVTGSVIILKENNSETYGEITSAANTLTIPEGYVWNGPADGVYTLAVASGFDGGASGKTFTIDGEVTLPAGKALTDTASAATGLTYAQAYALGLLDKTTGELKKDVTPTISIVNGKVVVSLDGTAVDANRYTVMLNVYQKTSLTAEWPAEPIKYELGSDKEAAGFTPVDAGFYKVGVTIENK